MSVAKVVDNCGGVGEHWKEPNLIGEVDPWNGDALWENVFRSVMGPTPDVSVSDKGKHHAGSLFLALIRQIVQREGLQLQLNRGRPVCSRKRFVSARERVKH